MSTMQVVMFATAMVLILGIALADQFHWLGQGRARTVLVFLCAAAAIAALRVGGLPPSWFDGSKVGFGIAVTSVVSAFLGSSDERTFRRPFFLGFGLSLFGVNVVQAVLNVL